MNKKLIITITLSLIGFLWFSCKQENVPAYNGKEYIQFYSDNPTIASVTSGYSYFFYKDAAVQTDTVWFKVATVGGLVKKTSYLKFLAFKDTAKTPQYPDAVAGTHYVPFDDPAVIKLMKVEPGQIVADVPVILKRDPSLKQAVYRLHFKIVASDDFLVGDAKHIEGALYVSDKLSQPSRWTSTFFLGAYGTVKHQFIIDQSGQRWDDDFIANTIVNDANIRTYYLFKFSQALKALNAERLAQGLTELRENPDDPNSAVTFPSTN